MMKRETSVKGGMNPYMKLLTIYTHRYARLLNDFATHAVGIGLITTKTGNNGGLFYAECRYDQRLSAFAKELMPLVTEIAIHENPIYHHSQKLQSIAHDLRKTPLYDAEQKNLSNFLRHSRVLHLEGYVNFRMADYREKLDMMSYTLIKKLKLNHQD